MKLEGTIVPPDGPESWPKEISKKLWIIFQKTHGLTVQGHGLIDGSGHKWWDLPCKPHHHNQVCFFQYILLKLIYSNAYNLYM